MESAENTEESGSFLSGLLSNQADPLGLGQAPWSGSFFITYAFLFLLFIGWIALDRNKRKKMPSPRAGESLPKTAGQKVKETFSFWMKADRKTISVGSKKLPIGPISWGAYFLTVVLAIFAPSLSLVFTVLGLMILAWQFGRAASYKKAQRELITRILEVCQNNLSVPKTVTLDTASSYITIDAWEAGVPTQATIRLSAKDASKKDTEKAKFAAAFSHIVPGDARWIFEWDTANMIAVGTSEAMIPEDDYKMMTQAFTIAKANLMWPPDVTVESIDMYLEILKWGPNGLPVEVVIRLDPKDAKKSLNDRARFAAAFTSQMYGHRKWLFEWNMVDLYARGVAIEPLSDERQTMLEKMFNICKANLSWDNDTTIECVDEYIKVHKWAGNEPADFDITISARDAKKKEEERANFERIFSLAMSEDRRYLMEWFPTENRIHGNPTPPLPRMAPLPEIDDRPWHEFPLGVGAGGKEIIWDCVPFPHALVVGKTGGGKSVIQRNILIHALSQPDEWQVALIDPKRVELGAYKALSTREGQGGVIDIALTLEDQVDLLEKVEAEMMRRYNAMEAVGINNAANFIEPTTGRSPKAVLLMVDEAFQLLAPESGSSDQIKENNELHGRASVSMGSIARLGRAAKVHMVVATQRPDAKILSGELKANLDCRIGCGTMDSIPSLMAFDDDSGTFITPVKGRAMIRQGGIPEEFQGFFYDADSYDVIDHIRKKMVIGGRDLSAIYPRLYDGEPGAPGYPIGHREILFGEASGLTVDYTAVEDEEEIEEIEEEDPFLEPAPDVDFSKPQKTFRHVTPGDPTGDPDEESEPKKKKKKGKGSGVLKKMYGDNYRG